MTDVLELNQLNLELQQKKLLMMSVESEKVQQKLSLEEIAQIKKDYRKMYWAFVSVNWAKGMTLGVAWQKALEQMNSFVATKIKVENHPMNNELIKINAQFRHDMAKHIMTSEYAEEKLSDRLKKSFLEYGEQEFKKANTSLNTIYQKYMPKEQVKDKTQQYENGKQNTQQIFLLWQLQQEISKGRAA